jgi:hypothetical protein
VLVVRGIKSAAFSNVALGWYLWYPARLPPGVWRLFLLPSTVVCAVHLLPEGSGLGVSFPCKITDETPSSLGPVDKVDSMHAAIFGELRSQSCWLVFYPTHRAQGTDMRTKPASHATNKPIESVGAVGYLILAEPADLRIVGCGSIVP